MKGPVCLTSASTVRLPVQLISISSTVLDPISGVMSRHRTIPRAWRPICIVARNLSVRENGSTIQQEGAVL